MKRALVAVVGACGSNERAPEPTPTPMVAPADAPTGCPYYLDLAFLKPLTEEAILIAPQAKVGSKAPQYAAEQRLTADGTLALWPASSPRQERDHRLFLSDDGGKMCTPDDTSCDGFDLAPDLVAFKGYASAAHDPKGRSFILTFHSYDRTPNLLIVSFDGKGKRLASWSSPQDCTEQAGVVLGRVAVMPCRGEDDKVGVYSSLVVHELATGKVRSRLRGSFRDSASLVVDDARFATWLPDDHSLALYHLADPDHPKVVWQTRLDLEAPALATAAGGIVAIAAENPWKGIILDAGTGKPKHTFHVDPCRP